MTHLSKLYLLCVFIYLIVALLCLHTGASVSDFSSLPVSDIFFHRISLGFSPLIRIALIRLVMVRVWVRVNPNHNLKP